MSGDGPPKGPPIAGAGGGPSIFSLLGPKKIALVAMLAVLVGSAAALVPRYLI